MFEFETKYCHNDFGKVRRHGGVAPLRHQIARKSYLGNRRQNAAQSRSNERRAMFNYVRTKLGNVWNVTLTVDKIRLQVSEFISLLFKRFRHQVQ